jgi:uncharacterized protein YigA (DUF484 family)
MYTILRVQAKLSRRSSVHAVISHADQNLYRSLYIPPATLITLSTNERVHEQLAASARLGVISTNATHYNVSVSAHVETELFCFRRYAVRKLSPNH